MGDVKKAKPRVKPTVYNVKTGEAVKVDSVDAKEYVASGGWSYEPPEENPKVKKAAAKPKAEKAE